MPVRKICNAAAMLPGVIGQGAAPSPARVRARRRSVVQPLGTSHGEGPVQACASADRTMLPQSLQDLLPRPLDQPALPHCDASARVPSARMACNGRALPRRNRARRDPRNHAEFVGPAPAQPCGVGPSVTPAAGSRQRREASGYSRTHHAPPTADPRSPDPCGLYAPGIAVIRPEASGQWEQRPLARPPTSPAGSAAARAQKCWTHGAQGQARSRWHCRARQGAAPPQ